MEEEKCKGTEVYQVLDNSLGTMAISRISEGLGRHFSESESSYFTK